MAHKETYAVFTHRGDGLYHLRDAHGARIYKRASVAEAKADAMNQTHGTPDWAPRGFVARPSSCFSTDGVEITPDGRVRMRDAA